MIWLILLTVSGAPKVGRFYVSAPSAPNGALVGHQKGGLTRFLDDLGIMHLRCTSIAIPHKPQSSILNPQFSILIVPQSVVHLCLYHTYHKCGTCGIHLPQCLKVRHFWHRCLKCLKWCTKWGTKLDIFQKKFSLVFVRVIHLKVNLGQLMKIFIFFLLGLSGGKG